MRILVTTLVLVSSISAFANIRRDANPGEVKALCLAIDKQLEVEQADMAVDMKRCLRTRMASTGHYIHGTVISGAVPFNDPNRSFTMNCSGALSGKGIAAETIKCR